MFTLVLQGLSWLAFIMGTVVLGAWLRRNPTKRSAGVASRILHWIFWLLVIPAAGFGAFYPGLTRLDGVLGLFPLTGEPFVRMVGVLALLTGDPSHLRLQRSSAAFRGGGGRILVDQAARRRRHL